MTQTSLSIDAIEEELRRRVRQRHSSAKVSSRNSAQKLKARAAELSELLGWIRKQKEPVKEPNVPNTDGEALGV